MAVVESMVRRRCTRTPVALGCALAVLVLFFHAGTFSPSASSLTWMDDINNATLGVGTAHAAPPVLIS